MDPTHYPSNFGYSIAGIEENIMSLDKSIQSGQEHRKPYSGSKAIDAAFRNHGSCKWRDNFTWICFNGDSEMCADAVDDNYCRECRLFEVKENE